MSVWACERVVCVSLWQVKPMLLDSSHMHTGVFFSIHFNLSQMILQSLHVFTLPFYYIPIAWCYRIGRIFLTSLQAWSKEHILLWNLEWLVWPSRFHYQHSAGLYRKSSYDSFCNVIYFLCMHMVFIYINHVFIWWPTPSTWASTWALQAPLFPSDPFAGYPPVIVLPSLRLDSSLIPRLPSFWGMFLPTCANWTTLCNPKTENGH